MGVATDRAFEIKHAIAEQQTEVRLRARRSTYEGAAWLRRLLCLPPDNVFDAGSLWRSGAAVRPL
jgi:hypothetical protein